MVDDSLLPHIEKIQSAHHVINLQREEIDKQNTIIQKLQVRASGLSYMYY
jgi:hypothetical protein